MAKNTKLIWKSFIELRALTHATTRFDCNKAKLLAYLKNDNNYRLISGKNNWKEFISTELAPLSLCSADRLAKIYQTYIMKLNLKEEDISNIDSNVLFRLTSIVKNSNVKHWLKKANELSRKEFYQLIKQIYVQKDKP